MKRGNGMENTNTKKMRAAAKYMVNAIAEEHTIETLAERSGVSPTTFKNSFRSVYGKPVHTWLIERRAARAARLLRTSPELSIGEIAFLVGYENAGKFSGVFRRIYGVTPREYRIKLRIKNDGKLRIKN